MEKKILLSLDDSMHSRHAIHYAVKMSSVSRDLTFTLFHVQQTVSQFLLDAAKTDFKAKAELIKVVQKNAEVAWGMLQRCKAQMVKVGIADKRIDVATHPKQLGLA